MPILLYMGLLLLFCIFIILLGIYSWKQGTLSYLIFFIVIMYIIMHIVFFLIFLWNVVVPNIFKKFKSLKKKILKKFSFIKRKYLGTKNGWGGLISKKDQRDILSIMYLVFILLFVYISYIMENKYASEIFFYYVITIFFVLLYCFWQ